MENQTRRRCAKYTGFLKGCTYQLSAVSPADVPANHHTGIQINDDTDIQPFIIVFATGNITDINLIWCIGLKMLM